MPRTELFDPLKRRWMAVADMVQGVFLQVWHEHYISTLFHVDFIFSCHICN